MAEFAKGICPECQRTISGRTFGRDGRKTELLRHKAPAGRPCNGTKRVVSVLGQERADA
jgi:hypothetical protein